MAMCWSCNQELRPGARFCSRCGQRVTQTAQDRSLSESLNIRILSIMMGLLILAVLFPPWESGPGSSPEYLGFHFILSLPQAGAVVSRILQTIELVTIAVAGLYGAWLFREKSR